MSGSAVVIGSGPNGLAAAITLAESGRDVTVIEAAGRAGGAVATEELTLPGFRHDTFSAVYPAAAASPVFARWPLERHGLRWVHPRYCYAHPLEGGRAAVLARDVDETAESLDGLHPGDGASWKAFVTPYVEHFDAWRATMLAGFPPVPGALRLFGARRMRGTLEWAHLLLMPAQALARRLFTADGSRAWLYSAAAHGDAPADAPGSAIAAAHLNVMGHAAGWPSPEGGAGRLAAALIGHLEAVGGRVRTGVPATRIAVERGRVAGVELAGGERLGARLVISTTMPSGLLALAGDSLGRWYAGQLRAYRLGPATLKVDWALDGPIPWSAPQAREAGTVHVGGLMDRPFMLLGQQSVADPERAPAGGQAAWAYTHGPQGEGWPGDEARLLEEMEAHVERHAPGFRDRILARHVMGPAELERRNPNLVGGDVGAGSYVLDQTIFRPVPGLSPYRTPVRGLYLGGASTFPGGAVHGVPGHAAARTALAEARVRRF